MRRDRYKLRKYSVEGVIVAITIFSFAFFITLFVGVSLSDIEQLDIEPILNEQPYAHLPDTAKEYVKEVYLQTNEIVLTEENKQENTPYLNPRYIDYLELSEEEKEKIDLVPDAYILDYSANQTYGAPGLPATFDLRNRNGHNFVSPIKDQGSTGVCWAFASIENVETLYMKNNNQSYNDTVPKFSVRQMDYATATDNLVKYYSNGIIDCPSHNCNYYPWNNQNNGSRKLGKGGNFFTSSIAMANGITLVDESVLPWNEDNYGRWPKDIFSYENSLYEVDSTIQMPTINADTAPDDLINSYVNDVKSYMMEYGGPFVGTYSPQSTCGFDNIDGAKVMKTDDCVNDSSNLGQGHAMQIIGWDDNYEYSYCDAGVKHYAIENGSCSSGELMRGKGAWIIRNSWGEESAYKYVYLTYDSTRLSVGFTTSVSEMATRNWDNNYHDNPWIGGDMSNGMASVSEQTKEFNTHNNKPEKIEKIKFVTASKVGKYMLSIIEEGKEYNNVAVVDGNEVGVYTVDLSDKDIVLSSNIFSIKIIGEDEAKFYNDSISVFTSNMTEEPYLVVYNMTDSPYSNIYDNDRILSYDNPLSVNLTDKIGEDDELIFMIHQKNLPSNSVVDFRIVKIGEETTSNKNINSYAPRRQIYLDEQRFEFEIDEYYYFREGDGPYAFQLLIDDVVVDTIPIIRSGTANYINESYSDVRLYANNGTNHYEVINVKNETYHRFDNENINNLNFFNNYRYIVGWNTKADGTGISYPVDKSFLIMQNMDLYAQWSDDAIGSISVKFDCQEGGSCYGITGAVQDQIIEYDKQTVMPNNSYERSGYKFNAWGVPRGGGISEIMYEGRYVTALDFIKYPVYNNLTFRIFARWVEEDNAIEISFDSNGGVGSMRPVNVQKASWNGNLISHTIKENEFSRPGYIFTGWNTEANGAGVSYNDKGVIQSDSDVKLYAQWTEENPYAINKYNYNESENYIGGVVINTTVDQFVQNIVLSNGYTVEVDYKIIDNKQVLYTGGKTRIYYGSNLYREFFNVVVGDVNGDGKISSADYIKIRKHIMGSENISELPYFYAAANANGDDNISSGDYIKIRKYIMNGEAL